MFPSEGITVTGVAFHMHDAGLKAYTQVVRNGQELPELGRVDPWDPSHPSIATSFVLLPGDTLISHCVYRNPYATELHWGSGLGDEMCVVTLDYYPRVGMGACVDLAFGFDPVPAQVAIDCAPGGSCGAGGSCDTFCGPSGTCSLAGACGPCLPEGLCAGSVTGPCAGCIKCADCERACLACNPCPQICDTSAPRVYCPNDLGAPELFYNPPARTASFVPYTSSDHCSWPPLPPPPLDPSVHRVDWRIPASPASFTIATGERVGFQWVGYHDLVLLPDQASWDACTLDTVVRRLAPAQVGGTVDWTTGTPGIYYFACSVAGHCAGGMKLRLEVANSVLSVSVPWRIPTAPNTVTVPLNGEVRFQWPVGEQHNVIIVGDRRAWETCDVSRGMTLSGSSDSGDVAWRPTKGATGTESFFVCSLPGHCLGGMKVRVLVGSVVQVEDHGKSVVSAAMTYFVDVTVASLTSGLVLWLGEMLPGRLSYMHQ